VFHQLSAAQRPLRQLLNPRKGPNLSNFMQSAHSGPSGIFSLIAMRGDEVSSPAISRDSFRSGWRLIARTGVGLLGNVQPGLHLLPRCPGRRVLFVCGDAPVEFFRLLRTECESMRFKISPERVYQLEFLCFTQVVDAVRKSRHSFESRKPGAGCQMPLVLTLN
jgi:hypothetical protein